MAKSDDVARMGALYPEHVLLGASFAPAGDGRFMRAESYPSEAQGGAGTDTAALCDLTGSSYVLVHGERAADLMEAAFCGQRLETGACAWECALTAEGALTSIPLVCRTGDHEYVLVDPSERGDVAPAWLGFLAGIEQDGYAPYAGTAIDEAASMLVPLLLAGNAARDVLSDYVASPKELPMPGKVADVSLDKIPCVVAGVPGLGAAAPAYVVFAPPARSQALWRSFLSFSEVAPMGAEALRRAEASILPWGDVLSSHDKVKPSQAALSSWGLLRADRAFVGARAL